MRTISVTQPALLRSALDLAESGGESGSFAFQGLLRRTALLDLGDRTVTLTTTGLLGGKVRAEDAEGVVAEFRQTGFRSKGVATIEGRRYALKSRGVLSHRYLWLDRADTEVVRIDLSGLLRTKGTIEVAYGVDPRSAAALIALGLLIAGQVADGDAAAVG